MEPDRAVKAAVAVKAKMVVPHHYGTFPILTQDPGGFAAGVKKAGIRYISMQPGGSIRFEGTQLQQ